MPYDSNDELPDQVRDNASSACQDVFREVYNDRSDEYDDEQKLFQIAWGVMTDRCSKGDDGDTWTKDAGQEQNAATPARPSGGVAQLAPASDTDDEDDAFRPEIVPIPEGEVTVGAGSEKRTEWSRDPLKQATEAGAFDNAKLVRGKAGINPHLPMDEQLSPEDIVGDAGTFHYEEGRGPVSNGDGVVVDEHLSKLVENELVEISPDMRRVIGEWDDSLADGDGAHSVEEIVDVPRMTILDKGASRNAELGPAEQEALAALPEHDELSAGGDDREQLAGLELLRFWPAPGGPPDAEPEPLSTFESTADALESITGVASVLDTYTEGEDVLDAELFAILDPHNADLGTLGEDIRDVLEGTPFEVGSQWNWVEELEHEQLAHRPQTMLAESNSAPAETGSKQQMSDDTSKEELREQLAEAKQQNRQYEEQVDDLEDETDTLESELDEKEDTIDDLKTETERLKDEAEFSRHQAAMIASGGNEGVAETLVESDRTGDELAEMALDSEHGPEVLAGADDEGGSGGDSDGEQLSPRERLNEQLAQSPSPRGGGSKDEPSGGSGGDLGEEQLAAADDLATSVMSGSDVIQASQEQLAAREFVRQHKGVDPAEYSSESALRSAIDRENGGEA